MSHKHTLQKILGIADIMLDGPEKWDITVRNDAFYKRVLRDASLGLGESYINKWWDCPDLDICYDKILSADLEKYVQLNLRMIWPILKSRIINRQTKKRALINGQFHYDKIIDIDLYEKMLGPTMTYSCGYWKEGITTLEEAQIAKLDLVCRKLQLQPGQRVLEFGCGFGSWAKYAHEHYGVEVVGVTISEKQAAYAKKMCKGLPIEIKLQDYREINERFDRIVSIGMFEHVGYKNFEMYMRTANQCLKDDGIFLLHTIGRNTTVRHTDPFIDKYIFPGGHIPSIAQIGKSIEKYFVLEDLHNFGPDYDKTLMCWYHNSTEGWDSLPKEKYTEKIQRTHDYYLKTCAASFRSRHNQLWQQVLVKQKRRERYDRIS